jgi:hypothetical protein
LESLNCAQIDISTLALQQLLFFLSTYTRVSTFLPHHTFTLFNFSNFLFFLVAMGCCASREEKKVTTEDSGKKGGKYGSDKYGSDEKYGSGKGKDKDGYGDGKEAAAAEPDPTACDIVA